LYKIKGLTQNISTYLTAVSLLLLKAAQQVGKKENNYQMAQAK